LSLMLASEVLASARISADALVLQAESLFEKLKYNGIGCNDGNTPHPTRVARSRFIGQNIEERKINKEILTKISRKCDEFEIVGQDFAGFCIINYLISIRYEK